MKKKIVILLAILLILIVPALFLNLRQGVYMAGRFYMPQENRDGGLIYRAGAGYEVTLDRQGDGMARVVHAGSLLCKAEIDWTDDFARVEFDDGTVVEGRWTGESLIGGNGLPAWIGDEIQIIVGGQQEPPPGKYSIACALCRMDREEELPFGSILLVLIGAAFYGFGMLNILLPEKMHFLGNRWRYENAELSDAGYASQVFGGIILLIAGAAIMYLPFFT